MSEKNKIRLVALIEEVEDKSLKKEYKIVNFLPDIKVEEIIENNVHLQDSDNKYRFRLVEKDMFQIPYTKEFKDLTVIVGENGSGKTTLINDIFTFGYRSSINFIFLKENEISQEENNIPQEENEISQKKNEILIYANYFFERNIVLEHSDEYEHSYLKLNTEKDLNIIKFSNAIEFYNINDSNSYYRMNASKFNNLNDSIKLFDIKNKEDIRLWETINQVKFVHKFKDRISEFVDYTKKGVIVNLKGERLPFSSGHLDFIDDITNDFINERLVAFYSILINYMIDIDYTYLNLQNMENLLDMHLSMLGNSTNIELQYKSISVDKDRFLPNEYSRIDELGQDELNKESNGCDNTDLIAICHSIFIIDLYFEIIRLDKKEDNGYRYRIENIINNLKELFSESRKSKELSKFSDCIKRIELFSKKLDNEKFNEWDKFWGTIKEPCIRVAKGVYYTSFFKLDENGCFVKHKLIPEEVMDRLRKFEVDDDEITHLEEIRGLLSKLDEINMDFEVLTSLIEKISELKNIKLSQFLEMKWRGLSSGELALLKTFSNLYSAKIALQRRNSSGEKVVNFLLLLDEVDLGLHPRWQRKWISTALPIIEKIFESNHLQIIITTHSPIFLSDIYEENIIFLPEESGTHNCRTFGQNIYSLFKNAFFLNEDEFIGEYAYQIIQDTIEYLRFKIDGKLENLTGGSLYNNIKEEDAKIIAKKIIDSIGEKIISNQLYELFAKAFPSVNPEIDDIKNQIKKLKNKLCELGEEEN